MRENDDAWMSQIRKGILELCVLAVIEREETYGYSIVERMGRLPGLEVTESTVYPLLARMSSEGLLSVRTQKSSSGPPRRNYRLSASGKQRLKHLAKSWQVVCGSVTQLLEESQLADLVDRRQ